MQFPCPACLTLAQTCTATQLHRFDRMQIPQRSETNPHSVHISAETDRKDGTKTVTWCTNTIVLLPFTFANSKSIKSPHCAHVNWDACMPREWLQLGQQCSHQLSCCTYSIASRTISSPIEAFVITCCEANRPACLDKSHQRRPIDSPVSTERVHVADNNKRMEGSQVTQRWT
jgi:hypothetical protein